jgi:hypothetical protein
MNQDQIAFSSTDDYPIRSAREMSYEEVGKWVALCNALKFINHTSELTGKEVEEKDIDYRKMLEYITSVGGDIETCLKETKGIPFKYSLNIDYEESLDLAEVNYEYLA